MSSINTQQKLMQLHKLMCELQGRKLKTLDHRKPFQIISITEEVVIVVPLETDKQRPIPREGIEDALRHLVVTGKLTLMEIENNFAPRNPVYVAAILAELPGVKYTIRPIVLRVAA